MGWSVDDVMPGRDGPENLRILKKSQLESRVGDSAIETKSWVFGSLPVEMNWELKQHEMCRTLGVGLA